MSNYGISPDNYALSASPSSGFALQVSNRALSERRKKDIKRYREFERKLFEVVRSVWNYHSQRKIDVKAEFKITFNDGEGILTTEEKIKQRQHDFEYGISSPIEVIMLERGLKYEEAVEQYRKNMEWKTINSKIFPSPFDDNKGDNEGVNNTDGDA